MVDAYRNGSRYDKSIWPEGYKSDSGCGVAATATALSGLGIQELPKDIYKTNGNSVNMDWSGVATANGVQVTQERKLAEKALTYEERVAMIDAALEKYVEHPDRYAPPIIGFTEGYNGGDNHYVVVYGKNADGSYRIVDSSGNNIQTYTLEEEDYWQDNKGKTFHANLNQIVQYYR